MRIASTALRWLTTIIALHPRALGSCYGIQPDSHPIARTTLGRCIRPIYSLCRCKHQLLSVGDSERSPCSSVACCVGSVQPHQSASISIYIGRTQLHSGVCLTISWSQQTGLALAPLLCDCSVILRCEHAEHARALLRMDTSSFSKATAEVVPLSPSELTTQCNVQEGRNDSLTYRIALQLPRCNANRSSATAADPIAHADLNQTC